jgi:hypothetical protein
MKVIIISLLAATLFSCNQKNNNISKATSHQCKDATHITCDGSCTCDGMECSKDNGDYQISYKSFGDSIVVTQDSEYITTLHYQEIGRLDSILVDWIE